MTPDERQAIMSLVTVPGGHRPASPDEVLERFGASDGRELGVRLLREAIDREDPDDVEMALIASESFGLTEKHVEPLVRLLTADWHEKHEDVVRLLGRLRAPQAVDGLYHAAQWIPEYLEYDDAHALARKAIWALGGIPGAEAEEALRRLLRSDSQVVRDDAAAQLRRRESA